MKKAKQQARGSGERAGVRTSDVVDAAIARLDRGDDLSLSTIAKDLGIQTPSLYTHIDSLEHLRQLVKVRALRALLAVTREAAVGRAGKDALFAVCDAQRAFVHQHPGLMAFTNRLDAADSVDAKEAADALLACIVAVLRGYGKEGDEALHATRILRAATHGFFALERAGGFGLPLEIDETWRRLKKFLHTSLQGALVDDGE